MIPEWLLNSNAAKIPMSQSSDSRYYCCLTNPGEYYFQQDYDVLDAIEIARYMEHFVIQSRPGLQHNMRYSINIT